MENTKEIKLCECGRVGFYDGKTEGRMETPDGPRIHRLPPGQCEWPGRKK